MAKRTKGRQLRCPHCNDRLLQKGVLRVDHPLTVRESGEIEAPCHFCGQAVELPLRIDAPAAEPRLVIPAPGGG